MFLYRLVGAILLGGCVGMGIWNHMSRRRIVFQGYYQTIAFLHRLRNGIAGRKLLITAMNEAAETASEDIRMAVDSMTAEWEQDPSRDFGDLWTALCQSLPLEKEDCSRAARLAQILGAQNIQSQLRQLDSVIRILENHVGEEEEAWRHQKNLYGRLSVLLGLLLTVILL